MNIKRITTCLLYVMLALHGFSNPIRSLVGANQICNLDIGEDIFPEGIIPVEYIESTGTQYSHLCSWEGTETNITYDVKCLFIESSVRNQDFILSHTSVYGPRLFRYVGNSSASCDPSGVVYGPIKISENWKPYNIFVVFSYPDSISFTVDGISVTRSRTFYLGQGVNVFHIDERYNPKARVFYIRIYANEIMIGDFRPVKFINENGEYEGGFYNIIDGNLIRNEGSGTYLYGEDL